MAPSRPPPPKAKIKSIPSTADLIRRDRKGKAKDVSLPGAIQVERFVEARAMEIQAFQSAIKSAAAFGNSRVFQSLPRHLRRRAASHNPRRVPKRLRSRAAAEIDPSSTIAKIQRKKAKLRGRGDLRGRSRTEQLLARQRDKTWLPTHIWHAKRFHMVNLWGYRLPLTPTLKSFRPAYRAARRHCAVHDSSYYRVIELEGDLSRVTAGRYAGDTKADILLYHPDAYPLGLIGPAEVIIHDKVWIRVHPAIYDEACAALKRVGMREVEVDSFELMGPTAGEVLQTVLRAERGSISVPANSAMLPRNAVIGARVYDPRLHFPPTLYQSNQQTTSASDIFDEDARRGPRFTKADLDLRRRKLGFPGTRLRPLAQDSRIPILIIQRSVGDLHGYTLLIPRGWSQYLLTSLAYTRCFIGGLAERRVQYREAGVPSFPEHYGAVCRAGAEWEARTAEESRARWDRKPPGKRPDYALSPSPFRPVWPEPMWLVQTPLLELISHLDSAALLQEMINAFRSQRGMPSIGDLYASALVHVRVEMVQRGSPKDMAHIYADDALIGYVTTGNFSLTRGTGHALGTVTLKAYIESRHSVISFVLHATPPLGGLPAGDTESLYLAALLQLVVPGRWAIQTGDYSAKLPYITHLDRVVKIRHLPNLPAWSDPDDAEAVIWRTYIEQTLTDLVNHTIYSLPRNYPLASTSQAAVLGPLERHYIPQRIHALHKIRLEHVGLWTNGEEAGDDKFVAPGGTVMTPTWSGWGREAQKRRGVWVEEELLRKARAVLDVLARRVGDGLFGDRPTTPDLMLFAHTTLLLTPAWPNPLLANLIRESYPRLVAHHDRIKALLFPSWDVPRLQAPPAPSWLDSVMSGREVRSKSAAEKRFERGRWAWFVTAGVAMVGYLLASGVVKVEFGNEVEDDEDDEEDVEIIDEDEEDD